MCNPAIIAAAPQIMAGVSAATAVVGVAQQRQSQRNTIQLRENQAEAAVQEYNFSQKNLENEAISQQDVVENELFNANIEAARARSEARAVAGSSGATGNSVAAIDQDINSQVGRSLNEINTNYDVYKQSAQSASDASYRTLQSTLTGLGGAVEGPSAISSGLKIGSAAAGGYSQGKQVSTNYNKGYTG